VLICREHIAAGPENIPGQAGDDREKIGPEHYNPAKHPRPAD
jgi:hypothetical protein